MSAAREMTRRDCLNWLARGALVAVAADCLDSAALAGDDDKLVKIADLLSVRNESAFEIEKPNVILSRTAAGIACMSIYCTHKRNKLSLTREWERMSRWVRS